MMAHIKWRKVLYSTGIILGLGLLAQQAWQGYQALQDAQACVVRPTYLFVALALYIVAYFVQMAAWGAIMRFLGAPLTPQAVVEGYALSFLPRYIPGSVWGYLSRNEWLAQTHHVGYGVSTTSSLLEATMLLVTATGLGALYWLPTQDWLPTLASLPFLTIVIATIALFGSWLAWQIVPTLAARISRKPVDTPAHTPTSRAQSFPLWGVTTALYVAFWLLQGGALVAIAHTLCGGLTLGLYAASAAFAIAWAIGFLIVFVPAGLGIREWTLSALLVAFAALQPGPATLIALISRLGLIVAEVVVLLIGLHRKFQNRKWQIRVNNSHI